MRIGPPYQYIKDDKITIDGHQERKIIPITEKGIKAWIDEWILYYYKVWEQNQEDFKEACPEMFDKTRNPPCRMYLDDRDVFYQNCANSYSKSIEQWQRIRLELFDELFELKGIECVINVD